MKALLLALAAVALLLGTFASWRRQGGAFTRTPWGWLLAWTLWCTEAGLTAWWMVTWQPAEDPGAGPRACLPTALRTCVPPDMHCPPVPEPTVLFVGDSFTAGAGVATADNLPSQVARRLEAAGTPARVLNHGREGQSFFEEVLIYGALGAPAEPEVVVWVFLLNDLGRGRSPSDNDLVVDRSEASGTGLLLVDVPLQSLANRRLEAETEASYQQAFEDETRLARVQGLLRDAVDELDARGGRLLFVLYPLMHDLADYPFRAEHERMARLAKDAGADVLDLLPTFEGRDETALWASVRDHHPNAAGHALAADAVAARLTDLSPSGPVDCARIPVIPAFADATRAACADPGPSGLDALASALEGTDRVEGFSPFNPPSRAADLRVVAEQRARP